MANARQIRATVALSKLNSNNLNQHSVDSAVKKAVDLLGGIDKFVQPGQVVGLKPNQTLWKLSTSGSTTSADVLVSLIGMCKRAGAKDILVIEASGHAQSTRKVMSITGVATAVKDAGAKMIYLEEVSHCIIDFGKDAPVRHMPVAEVLEHIDVFIDCPKAKTHFVDPISGACKNWVGLMPMSFRLHTQKEVEPYYQGTAQLLKRYRPALTVFDGTYAGEGQGPGSNKPFWWGYIIASDDPVAADVTVTRLFSLDSNNIRMAREAEKMGVGIYDTDRINVIGDSESEAYVKVQPADPSVYRFPCRVIVGGGSGGKIEGTLGHWKTIADAWLETGVWDLLTTKGTPTFMFGDAEDPLFEKHLKEGPYVVLDDSARDQYKYDSRVTFVPGSPVPQSYMQHEMLEGMGFGSLYEPGLKLVQSVVGFRGKLTGQAGKDAQRGAIMKTTLAATAVAAAVAVPLILRGTAHNGGAEAPSDEAEEESTADQTLPLEV